ncbi:ATP-binding protein [Rhizobium sp. CG4]|uniref:ATP-binding protein n=1 Tax=Rhizobium sp. CG4 TaxID=2726075 RepID=UPI0020341A23|nr:ATP-binding protein [Rhizobium sp. CG4]MCM2458243.1 ATP-binding protein [Rhizobium sp. CG4]
MSAALEQFEPWDPLEENGGLDPGVFISAQKREISNILRSYTGYYDLFAELLQNGLDAVERQALEQPNPEYKGKLWVLIDLKTHSVSVTDNGCGMSFDEFRQFLRPNLSFKTGAVSRGSKGVGATYLGYGFNHLRVISTKGGKAYSGLIEHGRRWVDDKSGTVSRPKIVSSPADYGPLAGLEHGTTVSLQLSGDRIRPSDLTWYQATTAEQWLSLLQIMTPVGGIYLGADKAPNTEVEVTVIDGTGQSTIANLSSPEYLYPHKLVGRSADLREFVTFQEQAVASGRDTARVPPKFQKLNGLWGQWSTDDLLKENGKSSPINLRLDNAERQLAKDAGLNIYVYLAFSTELWDNLNDNVLRLRKGTRALHGGLQLATRGMPQGVPLTIPMTNNIGFQNLAHVILHFDNAEPDLGRKGFQPEIVALAEKIAVSAVTAFRRRYHLLRKPGMAKIFDDELKVDQWIKAQEAHEQDHSLIVKGAGLFMPTEELPIRSEPLVEQDVVALFNQMLSSGLVRGIQLISSSQYNQYDGLYRVRMAPPFDKFIRGDNNPLGLDQEIFHDEHVMQTKVKVLEYKYNIDGLVEELQSGVKDTKDIGLAVAWELGEKWREMFDVTSLLDEDTTHHRQIHGTTHTFAHSVSGAHAFEAIILHDLVRFLNDPISETQRHRHVLSND